MYPVKQGDTLSSIARRFGVKVEQIRQWNGLSSDNINIGQQLRLPGLKVHTVGKGETLFSIGKKYGVSPEAVKEWNSLSSDTLSIGQKLTVVDSSCEMPNAAGTARTNKRSVTVIEEKPEPRKAKNGIVTVQKNDTFYRIARDNGLSIESLLKFNPGLMLLNGTVMLQPGMSLMLKRPENGKSVEIPKAIQESQRKHLAHWPYKDWSKVYIKVQEGQGINSIVEVLNKLGLNVKAEELIRENGIKNVGDLKIGQVLHITRPASSKFVKGKEGVCRLVMEVSWYNPTPGQCKANPTTTARGSIIKDGTMASNDIPQGSLVYDMNTGQFHVVEDRMNRRYNGLWKADIAIVKDDPETDHKKALSNGRQNHIMALTVEYVPRPSKKENLARMERLQAVYPTYEEFAQK